MARGYRTRQEQAELVARWRASGSTRAEFCSEVGVSSATFTRWLGRAPSAVSFAEVLPPSLRPAASTPVVVVLRGGTRLVIRTGAPMSLVAELVRVLG